MRKFLTLKYPLFLLVSLICNFAEAQTTVTIGTNTAANVTFMSPINSCNAYSYSQQIYTAAEITAANSGIAPTGQIATVYFYLSSQSNNTSSSHSNLWTIYIGNTTASTFASTASTSWIPTSSMTQVFSGIVTFPALGNWVSIPLSIPFSWDGTSNIVVAVHEDQPSTDCTMEWGYTSTSPNSRNIYYYNSSTDPTPATPPVATGITNNRPNIQLSFLPPCATASGFPTSGTVAATPTPICVSGNVSLKFTPMTAMPNVAGLTYQWQTATAAAGPYTAIPGAVTTTSTYTTTTPITASAYYNCVVLCGGTSTILTSSASNQVVVNNPIPTVTPGSRCGPGVVALSAAPPNTAPTGVINWYAVPSGGASLAAGTTFTTPYLSSTTNYYATVTASGCEGARTPVTATINTSAAIAVTSPPVICNSSIATITLTQPSTPYTSYTWTPTTNLYTNAAATIPYTGGNAANLYMKTSNVGNQAYYLMAGDPTSTTGCTYADTANIWVQPTNVSILGAPDTICTSGSSVLTLDTSAGYYSNSIQWQNSSNGTNYNSISGATNSTYTTPTLTYGQNTYYKALINAGTAICASPSQLIVVASPTLLSYPDSFNCGPGTVTLTPVTGGYGTAVWYTNSSGGYPIGYGSPFTTPSITTTTPFYVSSSGTISGGLVALGAGTLTSPNQTYSPFQGGYGGTIIQYLINASELSAIGIPSGADLSSLAMNIVSGGATYPSFSISMKNTTTSVLSASASFEGGTSTVFGPTTVMPTAGVNTYSFPTPFTWDGTSNVLIQMCWSNATTTATDNTVVASATSFVAAHRGQSNSLSPSAICGALTTTSTSAYSDRPNFVFAYTKRCETPRQLITAHIYPKPTVDLGSDIQKCLDIDSGITLSSSVMQPNPSQYLWNNNDTTQTIQTTVSGTYILKITNQYSCSGSDTVKVTIGNYPVFTLGNDTTICTNVTITLNPSITAPQYYWNTGQVTPTIVVSTPGTYSVAVTNVAGCTSSDSINVNMQGLLPTIKAIQVNNNGQNTFTFTVINPQNVIAYDWDFGDGNTSNQPPPTTHTYGTNGNYIVVLRLSSTCGYSSDTTSANIVGIHQVTVPNNELFVYPNPSNGIATITNSGSLQMQKIEVYNALGRVVYSSSSDSINKHVLDMSSLTSGMYTIEIYTDKGTVARKLEVVK